VPAIAAAVEGGSVRGPDQVRRFFADFAETWEIFRIDGIEYHDFGDCVMTSGRLTAKGRGSELELDHPIYMVIQFRDGKFARMLSYLDREAAVIAAQEAARSEASK
jgi:ketosteroid isomerase-like protein